MNILQIIALVLLGVMVTAINIYTETKYRGAHRRNNGTNNQRNRDFLYSPYHALNNDNSDNYIRKNDTH